MKTFAVQRNPELVSRASKIGVGSHAFFELRCQHAACKKDDAAVSLHIVRQVDLGFWTEPAELLKEPACDLSGSQIKRSELRLQVFQDQLVRFYALIANDNPGELSVNRDEPQGLNSDVTQPRETLFQVELFDPIGGFDQSHIRRVSERCSPGDALKTIRIVHHRYRVGEKGAAHTEQESQQEKVSARVISLPSDHGRTLPWPIIWRNSLSFVEIVLRHSL